MHIKPKKSLGQNFLIDRNIQNKIIDSVDLNQDDTVLEIGPGEGAITGLLCRNAGKVFAVEIDRNLCALLTTQFAKVQNLSVINADILKFDLRSLPPGNKLKVIGNIPYYITSPIVEHLLFYRERVGAIYLTVQKEFAHRMVADPGSKAYGSFSCFVQYYAEPEILFLIKKNSFHPAPKVDSCFLRMKLREEPAVKVKNEAMLFKIIRTAFQQRRKTMKNGLEELIPNRQLEEFFRQYDIDPRIRAEDLSLQDFANLANSI
jgi:16S rRNA (adenine1518-N6/adenine1519-N6)-dimethyltransferase